MTLTKSPVSLVVLLSAIFLLSFARADAADKQFGRNKRTLDNSLLLSAKKEALVTRRLSYDERMLDAAKIAEDAARSYSIKRCWRYVKRALVEAEVVDRYPETAYAKSAGYELTQKFGFKKIPVNCPYKAPVGAVLVYGGRGAGHVEIRTEHGFASDYASAKPSPRPLIGVYVKPKTDEG